MKDPKDHHQNDCTVSNYAAKIKTDLRKTQIFKTLETKSMQQVKMYWHKLIKASVIFYPKATNSTVSLQ